MDHLGGIGFSEEQNDLLEVAENFCRDKSPIHKVRQLIEGACGFDPEVWTEIVTLGWLGMAVPEEYGGAGLSLAEVTPVIEQMGRRLLASPFYTATLAERLMLTAGREDQKSEYLPKFIAGEIATLALAEAGGDWNFTEISAMATMDGDILHLTGAKNFVLDAGVSAWIIASVIYENKPALVLIETSALPKDALRRETIIDETKRSFHLTLNGLSVPKENLLDPVKAPAALADIHLAANLLASAEMVGATQAVIDYTIEYLQTRKQFGKLIGSYQALKHPTVDAYIQYEQARSHLYSAAHSFNEQGPGEIATRMAKATADKALSYAADRSIQFHGAFGFTYDCDAQLYRRRAIWHASQNGDAAYHRKMLAELLLS